MHSFNLTLRTELIFGDNRCLEIGKVLKRYNKQKVLIIIGQGHVISSGLFLKITNVIGDEGIEYVYYSGITPNPEVIHVRKVKALALEHKVDLILAVGGGSVIDVAKAAAVNVYHEGDELDFNKHLVTPSKALDIGVILTHASAGSEMSGSCVISDSKNNFKQGFRSDVIRPLFSICDPILTYTVSDYQTMVGVVDTLMHSFERYFSKSESEINLADRFAEAIFKTVIACGYELKDNPRNENARANLMLASTFSHNDVTSIGKKYSMPAHALEHALSALYPNIAHGHGLAIIFPVWLEYYLEPLAHKIANLGYVLYGLDDEDYNKRAKETITRLKAYFIDLGFELKLRNLGVKTSDIEILANIVTQNGIKELYHDSMSLKKDDIIKIYERCF